MMLELDAIDNSGQLSAHFAFQTRAKDLDALARGPAAGQARRRTQTTCGWESCVRG